MLSTWTKTRVTEPNVFSLQALALIELYNAPEGRYKQDVYLLPKKMGKDGPGTLFSCHGGGAGVGDLSGLGILHLSPFFLLGSVSGE